jgi:large subunit ribosomal protein L2
MGKRIISQRRGRGTSTYRAPSHNFRYEISLMPLQNDVVSGKIIDIMHSPSHTAPIAVVKYDNNLYSFIPAPEGVKVSSIVSTDAGDLQKGNISELKNIPEGTEIYNIEAQPGDGGKFIRASGVFGKVLAKYPNKIIVMLPSKKNREFSPNCRACIGVIAGGGRLEKPFLKAGKMYHKMKARNKLYPKVSGTSMNALDHPYGTSRSSKKGKPTTARKHAPPGAKVGKIRARRTGRKKGKKATIATA